MNDSNISKCKFSTALVPYLYGELPGSDVGAFESHLLDCVECTDEFAALSSARYEVYDWKKIEFDPLATPAIRIPYDEVVSVSWIDRLRIAFANGFAIPAVGFAGLVIALGLAGVFVWSGGDSGYVAKGNTNETVPGPVVATTVTAPAPEVAQDVKNESEPPTAVKGATSSNENRRELRPVKIKNVPVRAPKANPTSAQVQNAPRLNDFSDDEDNSLRLAELFEDIDTSD
jgi:hypothetical protein